jgi:hypothetical protein
MVVSYRRFGVKVIVPPSGVKQSKENAGDTQTPILLEVGTDTLSWNIAPELSFWAT